jgi:hypothetical protein
MFWVFAVKYVQVSVRAGYVRDGYLVESRNERTSNDGTF